MPATQLVLIPALLCDAAMYEDVIRHLDDTVEAKVMMSPKPSLAESVTDILSRAPAKFALAGTSYGGNLAIEVALAAPDRVTALWLMGCNPAGPNPGSPDLAAALTATPDTTIDMLAGLVVHNEAIEAAAAFRQMAHRVGAAAGAAQATALATRTEATSRLDHLTMPVLVLWGEADPLVSPTIGRDLARALPHAHFHVLANCGHLPTLEKPEECALLFAEFLGDEDAHHPHAHG